MKSAVRISQMSVAKDAVNLSSLTGRQHWLADRRETSFVGQNVAFSYRVDRRELGNQDSERMVPMCLQA
jgi:hypothetical protein